MIRNSTEMAEELLGTLVLITTAKTTYLVVGPVVMSFVALSTAINYGRLELQTSGAVLIGPF